MNLFLDDHHRIGLLLDFCLRELARAGPEPTCECLDHFAQELRHHISLEESKLLPTLTDPRDRELVFLLRRQHNRLLDLLESLRQRPYRLERFQLMRQALQEHLELESARLYPLFVVNPGRRAG